MAFPDKPGVYQIPSAAYHSSDGISCTQLKELIKSAAHYRAWTMQEKKQSEEMLIGRAVHTKILEPELFEKEYAVLPEKEFYTKDGKLAKNGWATTEGKTFLLSFMQEHLGKTILTQEQGQLVDQIVSSLEAKALFDENLSGLFKGNKELSFYWTDEETGVLCKCRPDVINSVSGLLTDLKVVADASDNEVQKTIARQLYFMQAAFYLDGIRAMKKAGLISEDYTNFVFVFIERVDPNEINCVYLSEDCLELGRKLYRRALRNYAEARSTGKWLGYRREIKEMKIPDWAYYAYGPIALEAK